MVIVPFRTDAEAIDLANNCAFGLGSNVFSADLNRANAIGAQLEAGMLSINDFATTYMCQSLPFGGVKDSGFDKFAGIEGLRGLCTAKSISEDRFPSIMNTQMPPLLQYPVQSRAFEFVSGLTKMFYYPGRLTCLTNARCLHFSRACFAGVRQRLDGLMTVIQCSMDRTEKPKDA